MKCKCICNCDQQRAENETLCADCHVQYVRGNEGHEMKKINKRHYIVESGSSWYVVLARTKRAAYSNGVAEFGRGCVRDVRRAMQTEIDDYICIMGKDAIEEIYE